ncbi:MAG: F0F1 ATP synthase subunit B [Patescibacteria group bacterium]
MEILQLFGVDWKLMLAQLVNFAIVAAVLWWFALKPLLGTMGRRNEEIAKGLSDAQRATERLRDVEQEAKHKLQEAKQEALAILEKAQSQAEASRQSAINKTKLEVENLINKAKQQIEAEKNTTLQAAKHELADILVLSLEKVLSKGLTKDLDKKYLQAVIKELKNER